MVWGGVVHYGGEMPWGIWDRVLSMVFERLYVHEGDLFGNGLMSGEGEAN